MTVIDIPSHVFPGFKTIGDLNDKQILDITEYFQSMEVGRFFGDVANDLGELTGKDGDVILRAIVSFMDLTDNENDTAILAKNLAESYKELSRSGINTKETNKLKSNLLLILNNFNRLKFSNIIRSYKVENSNNFGEAKLLSDIRIVPDPKKLVDDQYGVIIHKLYLEYQAGRDYKELHLHIGIKDLVKLRDQIEEAISQDKVFRESFTGNIKLI